MEAGSATIHVDAAVDIWAVGVIAFELLTGERAFPAHSMSPADAHRAAQDAIVGRKPLPWEGSGADSLHRLDKLRVLRRTVMLCLERDPAKRPSAAALVTSWDHTFDLHTRSRNWSTQSKSTT